MEVTFGWVHVTPQATVILGPTQSAAGTDYGGALSYALDVHCQLRMEVLSMVASITFNKGIAAGCGPLAHENLHDQLFLFSEVSQRFWDLHQPSSCHFLWMQEHHPDALSSLQKAALDLHQSRLAEAAAREPSDSGRKSRQQAAAAAAAAAERMRATIRRKLSESTATRQTELFEAKAEQEKKRKASKD
ncbi:hypothetical protein WJX73_009816 [Symbiochloris irregularis]|uniref:Uncharacterized protein n=1 Tax=Symbiochloris irregularis TaxID=706552 RepID=A0AAW1PUZ6_9CHLO